MNIYQILLTWGWTNYDNVLLELLVSKGSLKKLKKSYVKVVTQAGWYRTSILSVCFFKYNCVIMFHICQVVETLPKVTWSRDLNFGRNIYSPHQVDHRDPLRYKDQNISVEKNELLQTVLTSASEHFISSSKFLLR